MKYIVSLFLSLVLTTTTAVAGSSESFRRLVVGEFLTNHPIEGEFNEPFEFSYKIIDVDMSSCTLLFDIIIGNSENSVDELTGITYRNVIARILANNFLCVSESETFFTKMAHWLYDENNNVVYSFKMLKSDLLDENNNLNKSNVTSIYEKSTTANAVKLIREDAANKIEQKL